MSQHHSLSRQIQDNHNFKHLWHKKTIVSVRVYSSLVNMWRWVTILSYESKKQKKKQKMSTQLILMEPPFYYAIKMAAHQPLIIIFYSKKTLWHKDHHFHHSWYAQAFWKRGSSSSACMSINIPNRHRIVPTGPITCVIRIWKVRYSVN